MYFLGRLMYFWSRLMAQIVGRADMISFLLCLCLFSKQPKEGFMVLISDGKESRNFFCGVATKRGGGVRALPLRKKIFFCSSI